jgi:hypothetical protein
MLERLIFRLNPMRDEKLLHLLASKVDAKLKLQVPLDDSIPV